MTFNNVLVFLSAVLRCVCGKVKSGNYQQSDAVEREKVSDRFFLFIFSSSVEGEKEGGWKEGSNKCLPPGWSLS